LGPTGNKERSIISKKKGDGKVIEDREQGIVKPALGDCYDSYDTAFVSHGTGPSD